MRRKIVLAVLLACSGAAAAQNLDVIAARQAIYKGFGQKTKAVGAMLKGEKPFDLQAVKDALATYSAGAQKLPALFPDDSKTGHDTQASPDIWSHKDDFNARFATFGHDADAAATAITDKASFDAMMPKLLAQCGGCHKLYRVKS